MIENKVLNELSRLLLDVASKTKQGGVIVNEHVRSRAETRHHVNVLSHAFDFIHHDELLERLEKPKARPFCLLTFDDGKRSHITETAPELERLGVPAVFYVVTRALTDGTPLWFDRHRALVRSLGYVPPGFEIEKLKKLSFEALNGRLERELAKHGVMLKMDSDDVRPMSWDDARALARRGFTIGAHAVNHAILTNETETRAHFEIEQSIAEVTAQLEVPCVTFAFPNGNYTPQLAQYALECGVQTVMTTDPMWVDGRFPRWRLPRIELSKDQSRSRLRLKLAVAATGRILANPNGEGRQYRKKRKK